MSVYNREAAVRYAETWALRRNPRYLDFELLGGDCTNFASQCLYAGCGEMRFGQDGWYYETGYRRTPSWTDVDLLYNFLVGNRGVGPHARLITAAQAMPGDLVQLGHANGDFYHSPVIVAVAPDEIYVAAHSSDEWMRPLSDYDRERTRFLRIEGSSEA